MARQIGRLAGACLVSIWEDWPLIGSLAIRPDLRGHGLAGSLMRHALGTLHTAYPVVRLFVTMGNPAESLYRKLSFISGSLFCERVHTGPFHDHRAIASPWSMYSKFGIIRISQKQR